MKVTNVTLPLSAMLLLSGSILLAPTAMANSALDPYSYIQAPTRAEREAASTKKTKKIKVKQLKTATKIIEPEDEPVAKAPQKAATVILSTDTPSKPDAKIKPAKESTPEKTASNSSNDGGGFLDGIKQSTGGIAKSTRAVGSSVVSGTKSVGTKIAEGFKTAGEKVKDSTSAAGEKVKEGGSSVGGKVATGFKTAGGSLAAIPKAVGSAAGKVGASTSDGAKKLAAGPAAGFGAISHGINKINPFHKDDKAETPVVAQKSKDKEAKTELAKAEKTSAPKDAKKDNDVEEKTASSAPVDNLTGLPKDGGKKVTTVAAKAPVETPVAKASKPSKQTEVAVGKTDDGGIKKKIASAPKAGIEATKAGLDKTRAGVGAISHSITKLNPFHHGNKDEAPVQATAAKPVETAKPNEEPSAAVTKLGERIELPDQETAVKEVPATTAVKEERATTAVKEVPATTADDEQNAGAPVEQKQKIAAPEGAQVH